MFGIGTTEVLIILVVALLVIGPSKLPEVAKALGKGMAEFKKMSSDVKRTIDMETHLAEMEQEEKERQQTAQETPDPDQGAEFTDPPTAATESVPSAGLEEESRENQDPSADPGKGDLTESTDSTLEDASHKRADPEQEDPETQQRAEPKNEPDQGGKRDA